MSPFPPVVARRAVRRTDSRHARQASRWFAFRLVASIALTLAVIGVFGYAEMAKQLRSEQQRGRAAVVRADVASFEAIGRSGPRERAINRIGAIIDAVGRRSGTVEALLIDPDSRIEVSGGPTAMDGRLIRDPRITAALRRGTSWLGKDSGPHGQHLYEVIAPVRLPWGTYAYEVSYDLRVLASEVYSLKRNLALLGMLGLLLGGFVFYVVGGRRLLRDHRNALSRITRDGLTDLPNHRAFQADVAQAVGSAARIAEPLSLLVFDVDGFRAFNERQGHAAGDTRLLAVAEVLRDGRAGDRPFRIGGDEFAVLLAHTDEQGAHVRAARLVAVLEQAGIVVSMGLVRRRAGQSAESLREEASAALAESRRRGGGRVTDFEEIRDAVSITTSDKRDAVLRLLEGGLLSVAYQPIWDLHGGGLVALEALARPEEDLGLAGPAEAFDIAEQLGRVHHLDRLCVHRALAAAPRLPDGALLFVNVTPQTLDLDADGSDWLRAAVLRAGLTPERVAIEVTERFGGRTETVVRTLTRLRAQGFKLALDDVGTGNAGLDMLRGVAPDFVKLDRSIVAAAPTDPNARAVLMAMATFASHTGSFVIAEGIEDAQTLEFVQTLDAAPQHGRRLLRGGQGFGLGRPSGVLDPPPPELLAPAHVG